MKLSIYLLAPALCALAGCAEAPPPVTTTTRVTREVTTTGPTTQIAGPDVIVTHAPPAVRVETQTVSPGPTYVWTRGHWRWTGNNYVWVSGAWVVRPRTTAVWVEGHWAQRGAGYLWVAGHWQ